MTQFNPRILLVSLGNPDSLYRSYHSAGHHALSHLHEAISRLHPGQPRLVRGAYGALPCMVSEGDKYTLVQSPTSMNASGPFVKRSWLEMAKQCTRERRHSGMVVVHDEMEKVFGTASIREWDRKRRGHNGLKSIDEHLDYTPWRERGVMWKTMGIGIGRPMSREPQDVSAFVLRKMNDDHMKGLRQTGESVLALLEKLEKQWLKDITMDER